MEPRRVIPFLLPLGLVLGLALGLVLSWGPLASLPVSNSPASLRRVEKEAYIRLVAAAYAEEQDLRNARRRLDALEAGNAPLWVAELARRAEAEGDPDGARALARLAIALELREPKLVALAATPTATPAPGAPRWSLVGRELLQCGDYAAGSEPALLLRLISEAGEPLPGVMLELTNPAGGRRTVLTDGEGEAQTAFVGEWTLELDGADPVPISDAGLVPSCAEADNASPHAVRVTLQRQIAP